VIFWPCGGTFSLSAVVIYLAPMVRVGKIGAQILA
jgi:hypothetical protein